MASIPPRLTRLFEHAEDLDVILVVNAPEDPTFFWATGLHEGGTFEGSAAVLRPGQRPTVVTSPLEETTARKSDNDVVLYQEKSQFLDELRGLVDETDTVGVDLSTMPVERYRTLESELPVEALEDASDAIEQARLVKDPDEIEAIEAACRVTDEMADRMETYLEDAETEAELAANLVHRILTEGGKPSFDPIVAAGEGAAEPHYSPGSVRLEEGCLLVDMGAKLAGYCSDITRTYSLGPPDDDLEAMHATVLEAQQAALDAIEPGIAASKLHEIAAESIDATRFEGRFIHSLGHSLGVEVHDGPGLSPNSEVVLEEGMVFTVEPGIYVPGQAGVRIEEDIVVTSDGCRRLTSADRALRDVTA